MSQPFSNHSFRFVGIAAAALLVAAAQQGLAQVALLDPVAWSSTAGGGFSLGYSITVGGQDLSVSEMGYFDRPHTVGLFGSYDMGIWDSLGSLVASATVPSGNVAPLIGDYHYVALGTPVILQSGHTYTIGAKTTGADDFFWEGPATVNGATIVDPALFDNTHSSLVEPTSSAPHQFFEVNLMVTPVPEPATYSVAVGLAMLGFASWSRVRK